MSKRVQIQIDAGLEIRIERSNDGEIWVAGDSISGPAFSELDMDQGFYLYSRIVIKEIEESK